MSRWVPAGCLFLFGLLLAAVLGTLNFSLGSNLSRQVRASHWPVRPGRVESSRLFVDDSGDGISYIPQVNYLYQVEGRWYKGHRVRWMHNFTQRERAQSMVDQHPAGADVKVFVNPKQPEDVVLCPGLEPGDLQAVLFVLPFDTIVLGLLLSPWLAPPLGSGYPESKWGHKRYLHIQYRNPWLVGLAVSFGLEFALVFFNALVFQMQADFSSLCLELGLVLWVSCHAAWLAARSNRDRERAIEVDLRVQTLSLPGQTADSIAGLPRQAGDPGLRKLSQVRRFLVEDELGKDSDGDEVHHFWVVLELQDQGFERVHRAGSRAQAEAAVAWLNQACDLQQEAGPNLRSRSA